MRLEASSRPRHEAGHSAFAVAICLLGVMALTQLVVAGLALAVRFKESQSPRVIEREVIREVLVKASAAHAGPPDQAISLLPQDSYPPLIGDASSRTPMPELQPTPLEEPPVEDPEAARLLTEAREARVAGDMGKAIVKLEQALHHSPGEPSVIYEQALVHEQMGIFDKASDYYLEVYQMGQTRAGALFPLAARKLSEGFSQPSDLLGKLSLGRIQVFKNPNDPEGEQAILTIPVQKAPKVEVEMDAIAVEVHFFNRTNRGDVVELQDRAWVSEQWISQPWDWAGGEEQLRVTYTIPKRDLATDHLFGELSYYGQVVTLTYEGEVLDVQARPRDLAARISRGLEPQFNDLPVPGFSDSLPPGFDPQTPLLPSLPE